MTWPAWILCLLFSRGALLPGLPLRDEAHMRGRSPLPSPPQLCFLLGTTPSPWQRVGRVPGEEVVIFLNDFKG